MLTTDELVAIAHTAQAPTDDAGRPIPLEARPAWVLDELARIAHAVRAATLEEAATVADELREYYAAIKDTALLNGNVDLSNAASGEPRACEAIADILRSGEAAKLKG